MAVVRSTVLRESEIELNERLRALEKQVARPGHRVRRGAATGGDRPPGNRGPGQGHPFRQRRGPLLRRRGPGLPGRREAAAPLGEAARNEPAFRVFALAALSLMNDYAANEQLYELLRLPSVETRYGAFRALCVMNRNDPLVRGEYLGGQFSYHVLDGSEPPMIHVTRSRRPEIVLFGREQRLAAPLALEAGNHILVTGVQAGRDHRQQVLGQRAGSEADRLESGGRCHPRDRGAWRDLSGRGPSPAAGEGHRGPDQPVRGGCPARARPHLRPNRRRQVRKGGSG